MKTVKTPKGTELPLIQLKGKDYLQVAHRLQWFNEVESSFEIKTEIIRAEKDESIVKATIFVFSNKLGCNEIVKSSSATKREDAKGFADHLEKAETGAIGRALALLGYGTQFAVADLDEGSRVVDSPVTNLSKIGNPVTAVKEQPVAIHQAQSTVTNNAFGSFRKGSS